MDPNLALGIFLNLLCENLFTNIPGNDFDADDQKTIGRRVKSVTRSLAVIIPFVVFEGDDEGTLGKFIYYGAFVVSICSRSVVSNIGSTTFNCRFKVFANILFSLLPVEAKAADSKWLSIAMAPKKVLRKLVGWDDV